MEATSYVRLHRNSLTDEEQAELQRVDELARGLEAHLAARIADIRTAHVHGAASSSIQLIVASLLREQLGFREEVVLTPADGFVTYARPDFYYPLGPGRGILAEVERGGTTTNNHDLKDIWKTHISPDAQHLFLIVPLANWNRLGQPREKPFHRVTRRMAAFFGDKRREIDVTSVHIFGYGATTL